MIASVPSPNASGTVASPVQVSDSPVASVQNAIVPDTTYTTASAVQVPDSLIAPVLKRIHPFFLPPPRVVAPVTEGLTHEMRFNALARQEAVPALPQPRHRQTGRLRLRLSTPPFIQTDVLCLPPRLLGRPRHPILMSADTEHPPPMAPTLHSPSKLVGFITLSPKKLFSSPILANSPPHPEPDISPDSPVSRYYGYTSFGCQTSPKHFSVANVQTSPRLFQPPLRGSRDLSNVECRTTSQHVSDAHLQTSLHLDEPLTLRGLQSFMAVLGFQ